VIRQSAGMVPNPAVLGGLMPVQGLFPVLCGVRYLEHPDGGVLRCRECPNFAIGPCADCGTPVCGSCSGVYDGKLLWRKHLDAAVIAHAEARLTPVKFLAIAEAAGNPGLQSWTVVQWETRTITRKEGLFRKPVAHEHATRIDLYEIHGWSLPDSDEAGSIHGAERLIITDEGQIGKPAILQNGTINKDFIGLDYKFPDWKYIYPPEDTIDRSLRYLCKKLKLPV
jgi:hypothetical protein